MLRGRVVEHDGEPAGTFRVRAVWVVERNTDLNRTEDFVDVEDGRFELGGLRAGRYSVSASRDAIVTSRVEVELPQDGELLLQLPQPGSMSGVVVDADGVAIPGAQVRIHGPGGRCG